MAKSQIKTVFAYRYNYVQILIVFILLPFAAILIGISPSADVTGFFSDLVGKIPLCDVWPDLLTKFFGGISVDKLMSSAFTVIYKALPESLLLSLCIHFCILVSKKLNEYAVPILATFLGIVIASVLKNLFGLTNNDKVEIALDIGAALLIVIGIRLLSKGFFRGLKVLSLKQVLLFFVNGLFSVLTTAYVSGLLLAMMGAYPSIGKAAEVVFAITGIELVASILVSWINAWASKDKDIMSV